jgi:hypothetical protein
MHTLSSTVLNVLKLNFMLIAALLPVPAARAAGAKTHSVALGSVRKAISIPAAPAVNSPDVILRVRPLLVDSRLKEWTTGDAHDVTDRSFAIRSAMKINDALPGETAQRWIWQSGPWLLVDRQTGHITVLHLPDYDPEISDAVWFRDYAAYCGVSNAAKTLYAVVAHAGSARPMVLKEIAHWQADEPVMPACAPAV